MPATADDILCALRAAGEPTRLRLLAVLAQGEFTVSEITAVVAQSQPRVSRHLKVLLDAGLLIRFREQHWVFYRTATTGAGATLVAAVLDLLPRNDARFLADLERLAAIRKDRAGQVADYLAQYADEWARARGVSIGDAAFESAVANAIGQHDLGDLLDMGSGEGRMLRLLGGRARSATGIDMSTDMLNLARTRLHAAGLERVMVRHGDIYQVPYEDASFDTITIDQVLYRAERPERVVAEAARLLRPGGRLLVVDFAPFASGFPARGVPVQTATQDGLRIGLGEESLRRCLRAGGFQVPAIVRLKNRSPNVLLAVAQPHYKAADSAA